MDILFVTYFLPFVLSLKMGKDNEKLKCRNKKKHW